MHVILSKLVSNLVVLQVLVPLIAGIICAILNSKRSAQICTLCATTLSCIITFALAVQITQQTAISYHMGGWASSYGIELRVNSLSVLFLILINFFALISTIYSLSNLTQEISIQKIHSFYACFLLCICGFTGMVVSHDVFNIYVFLEISSLSAYVLVAMNKKEQALIAAFDYLILGTIGATFYLIGIGFLYAHTGILNVTKLHEFIANTSFNRGIYLALIFIVLGLGIKAALFPLHTWLLNVYCSAPRFVRVFFSAVSTKVSIYLLIKMLMQVFTNTYSTAYLLFVLALCAIVFGTICACIKKDPRVVLTYSSIAQIGYIILGISLSSAIGLTVALLNVVTHSIAKATLFITTDCAMENDHTSGKNKRQTISSFILKTAFVSSSLSLIGIPITAGFISKWYLLYAFLNHKLSIPSVVASIVIITTSLGTLFYTWPLLEKICIQNKRLMHISTTTLLPLLILTGIILLIGIYPALLVHAIVFIVHHG